jgi:glycerol-3-phosphate dehydrogenase
VLVNHARVTGLLRSGDHVSGAVVTDAESGDTIEASATVVVNATGVWSDDIRTLEDPDERVWIRPSKGIHIVLSHERLSVNAALLVPAPDGRYVFVIPWEAGRVVVGTTDEDYTGPMDAPRAERPEIEYLLDVLNRVVDAEVGPDDVVASFAGLRPLIQRPGQSTKDLSRRHKVLVGSGNVVTITGGKLTTWRPMAADTVDAALAVGGFAHHPNSRTETTHLVGGDHPRDLDETLAAHASRVGVDPRQAERLRERYGSRAAEVLDLVEAEPDLGAYLHPQRPYLRAEAAYAITHEDARTVPDVLERRLRVRITASDRGLGCLDWVADRLAKTHAWDDTRREAEVSAYTAGVTEDMEAERGTLPMTP